MAAAITFDVTAFRAQCPAFADATLYPDAILSGYWDAAACHISTADYGSLNGDCRARALNLMTAHLTTLAGIIASGKAPALLQGAGIDKVTVTLTPPPLRSQWQWWLSTTPYGAQLLAILQGKAVGGFYVGGAPERAAFRSVGGFR